MGGHLGPWRWSCLHPGARGDCEPHTVQEATASFMRHVRDVPSVHSARSGGWGSALENGSVEAWGSREGSRPRKAEGSRCEEEP